MRPITIAGNWKMNKNFFDAIDFFGEIENKMQGKNLDKTRVIICPPTIYLDLATEYAVDVDIYIGAQDVSAYEKGAYTGETSASMLGSILVDYCIVGHSERREYHRESNAFLNKKIQNLQKEDVIPIYCVGETQEQRKNNQTKKVILTQLNEGLKNIEIKEDLLIAYEPIWAIGSGLAASPMQAQEVHSLIRNWLVENYSDSIAQKVCICYGGSMNPQNMKELIEQEDIDGGLIGGACLEIESFIKMINIAQKK